MGNRTTLFIQYLRGTAICLWETLLRFSHRLANLWRQATPANAVAVAKLSHVVELHFCVANAIRAAVEHSSREDVGELLKLSREQRSSAHSIGNVVRDLGGSPPRSDESHSSIPRDPRAMAFARDQLELMQFVREDLEYVRVAHLKLASVSELPLWARGRLDLLLRNPGGAGREVEALSRWDDDGGTAELSGL